MSESAALEGSHILIVDDDKYNVDVLRQSLGDQGFVTDTAYGGQEALDKVRSNPPDLLLLDVMMPDIDGITVCQMLKDDPLTRLIPIVIMTALNATEDRVRGIEAGADDFLSKPIDERELIARIRTALGTKKVVDQTIEELRSASEQLHRLGTHEEELTVIVIELGVQGGKKEEISLETKTYLFERYRAAYSDVLSMFSGEVAQSEGNQLIFVVRSKDSEFHSQLAIEASLAIQAEGEALNQQNSVAKVFMNIAIDTGNAEIGSTRIKRKGGIFWGLSIKGKPIDNALQMMTSSSPGEIVVSDVIVGQTQTEYAFDNTDGVNLVLGPSTKDELPKEKTHKDGIAELNVSTPVRRGNLPWPAEYRELESVLWASWEIEDLYLIRVLSGKSGALVYAVDITARDFNGQAILKLVEIGDSSKAEEYEAAQHHAAVDANPTYAEKHLPTIVVNLEHGRYVALLATIAARGLEYAIPWVHCVYEDQLEAARQISSGLLGSWNESYSIAKGLVSPATLLTYWLNYRLNPDQGGRLHSFLSEQWGIDPEIPTFFFEGEWFPNPLAFALDLVAIPERLNLRTVSGNTHGDLHGNNVLVGKENGHLRYHLIDLAFYKPDAYLLYDHAYFEFSHLLHQRRYVTLNDWLAIVKSMERGSSPQGDDIGLIQLFNVVRGKVLDWVNLHEPNRLSYLESQFMLARVAVGMNFSHKRIPTESQVRAMLYAAECLKSYLNFHKLDWPKDGEAAKFNGDSLK